MNINNAINNICARQLTLEAKFEEAEQKKDAVLEAIEKLQNTLEELCNA